MRILCLVLSCACVALVNTQYSDHKFDQGSKDIPAGFDTGSIPGLFKLLRENWQSTIGNYRDSADAYDSQRHIIQEVSSNARVVVKNSSSTTIGMTFKRWIETAFDKKILMILPLQWYENLWHFIEKALPEEVEGVIAAMKNTDHQPPVGKSFITNIGRGAIRHQDLYWMHIHANQSESRKLQELVKINEQTFIEKRNITVLRAERICCSFTYKLDADREFNHEVLTDFMKQFTDYCAKQDKDIGDISVEISRDLTEIRALYPESHYADGHALTKWRFAKLPTLAALCILTCIAFVLYKKRILS